MRREALEKLPEIIIPKPVFSEQQPLMKNRDTIQAGKISFLRG